METRAAPQVVYLDGGEPLTPPAVPARPSGEAMLSASSLIRESPRLVNHDPHSTVCSVEARVSDTTADSCPAAPQARYKKYKNKRARETTKHMAKGRQRGKKNSRKGWVNTTEGVPWKSERAPYQPRLSRDGN